MTKKTPEPDKQYEIIEDGLIRDLKPKDVVGGLGTIVSVAPPTKSGLVVGLAVQDNGQPKPFSSPQDAEAPPIKRPCNKQ